MSTPSKKLNEYLYGTRKASERRDAEMAVADGIPDDRDVSPETQSALERTRAILKAAGARRTA